ncbi:MAG: metal-sensitive transcriptional regulator [Proteobacteria bacterium]|nr:metal-sensitive transcriptional regulator [Pseudomonadota bacterium]
MKDCCGHGPETHHEHPDHSGEISRVNRISGQLAGVKKMIEEHRYCPEILIQLRAIRSAVKALEANILETHLGHCVNDAMNSQDAKEVKKKIKELQEIFKRFD